MHFAASDSAAVKLSKNADGTGILTGLPVFRSGTFRDSRGTQHTFTSEDLNDFVANFNHLKRAALFSDPPVRTDHTRSVKDIVGYVTGLSTDGKMLFADAELTEPEAVAKWDRKTYRARSSEVGEWTTNDEQTFAPVFRGLAFVDVGAVDGLYDRQNDDGQVVFVNADNKESPVPEPKKTASEGGAPATFTIGGQSVTDPAAVQSHITTLEAAAAAKPAEFTIGGEKTTDFAKVAAHIDTLEKFVADARDANRKAFVTGLVTANKITAPQAEGFTAFVATLSDEQYTAFTAQYEKAPALPLFGKFGDVTNPEGGNEDPVAKEKADLEDIVQMHERSGLPAADIAKTSSFQRLQVLKAAGK